MHIQLMLFLNIDSILDIYRPDPLSVAPKRQKNVALVLQEATI